MYLKQTMIIARIICDKTTKDSLKWTQYTEVNSMLDGMDS